MLFDINNYTLSKTLTNCSVLHTDNLTICEDRKILISGGGDSKLYLYDLDSS